MGASREAGMFDNANTVFAKAVLGAVEVFFKRSAWMFGDGCLRTFQPQPVVVWLVPGTCMLRFLPVYA
jgi:hypothetical protein